MSKNNSKATRVPQQEGFPDAPSLVQYDPHLSIADPSFATIPAWQRAHLHEVADLMLAIYETLVEMQYFVPESIICGPHDITLMLPNYTKLKLDPAIIYLYTILPYIDRHVANADLFFQLGEFYNHLNEREVVQGRDPCYVMPQGGFNGCDEEDGEYMRPWYTPISQCGNHGSILIYDAREHRAWLIHQIERHSTDPFFCRGWYGPEEEDKSDWGGSGDNSNWSDDKDEVSQGSSDFWEDEETLDEEELAGLKEDREGPVDWDEGFEVVEELGLDEWKEMQNIKNQNSLDLVRSRPAGDVLRDIRGYFRDLKEPLGGHWTVNNDQRRLYQKHGWPDSFNAEAFIVDRTRVQYARKAKRHAHGPLDDLKRAKNSIKYVERDMVKHQKLVSEAQNREDEWVARVQLWLAQERVDNVERDIEEASANAERMCPNGVCQKPEDLALWEYERLRRDSEDMRERAQKRNRPSPDDLKDDPKHLRYLQVIYNRHVREASELEKALAASKADVERLCPGKTFQAATGFKAMGHPELSSQIEIQNGYIQESTRALERLKFFAPTVPDDIVKAREIVKKALQQREKDLQDRADRLQKIKMKLTEEENHKELMVR